MPELSRFFGIVIFMYLKATIVWPNGADVAPEVLYESVLRTPRVLRA